MVRQEGEKNSGRETAGAPRASGRRLAVNFAPVEYDMNLLSKLLSRLIADEQGGEVLEYALIAGLIVVAAIAVIGAVGTKVLARWESTNSSM